MIMVTLISMPSFCLAQVGGEFNSQKFLEEDTAIIEPGILPNSFWYWADLFAEQLKFVFLVGKENKADYLIQLSEERLSELRALSEAGINNYASYIMQKYEQHISRANQYYEQIREEAPAKLKEVQDNLEYQILEQEYDLKDQLNQVPDKYQETRDATVNSIWYKFKQFVSHLTWKKGEIDNKRAEFEE